METGRRGFLGALAFASMGLLMKGAALGQTPPPRSSAPEDGPEERAYWSALAGRLASPVLGNLAKRTLRRNMPVETVGDPASRRQCTYLEAAGRLLAGIAPWLELDDSDAQPSAALAREALDAISDPKSPDYGNFGGAQSLVDAAFLAQALMRAPKALWEPLDARVKGNLLAGLRATRAVRPYPSNWLLFSAMVETALLAFGEPDWDRMRIDYALRQHEQWYKGDGIYGDGAMLHIDYYNSFVIQPMLVDVIRHVTGREDWKRFEEGILKRARRYAQIQERMVSPEGTFPPVGRSLTYRCGALQGLAQMALLRTLPDGLPPAQARGALGAVIRRMMEAPGTFDDQGWLRIGFCGHQPGLGEPYISTGSLYLCAAGLLPLGLPAADPFWAEPPVPWTAARAWNGEAVPIDHGIDLTA